MLRRLFCKHIWEQSEIPWKKQCTWCRARKNMTVMERQQVITRLRKLEKEVFGTEHNFNE